MTKRPVCPTCGHRINRKRRPMLSESLIGGLRALRDRGPLDSSRSNGPTTIATGTSGALSVRGLARYDTKTTRVSITELGLKVLSELG